VGIKTGLKKMQKNQKQNLFKKLKKKLIMQNGV